jgi:tetratricopeptide (TPR) repeat protein
VRRGSNELQVEIENYLRAEASPYVRALVAYAYRDFPRALDLLATTLRRTRFTSGPHADRALIFHHMGRLDSAVAETRAALEELRRRDQAELVAVYESKALLEFSLGVILEAQGDADGARQAFERSATEDLGFHPAHLRLAGLAFQRGDAATAAAEAGLAIDARPDDAGLLVAGAVLLLRAARATQAVPHLERAVERNPHWATPRYLLARLYDSGGLRQDALAHYGEFLARAARDDARSAFARERLAALQPPPADTSGASIRH